MRKFKPAAPSVDEWRRHVARVIAWRDGHTVFGAAADPHAVVPPIDLPIPDQHDVYFATWMYRSGVPGRDDEWIQIHGSRTKLPTVAKARTAIKQQCREWHLPYVPAQWAIVRTEVITMREVVESRS